MWYEHDPWGDRQVNACNLFGKASVCRETFQGRIILMSAIVTAFIVDVCKYPIESSIRISRIQFHTGVMSAHRYVPPYRVYPAYPLSAAAPIDSEKMLLNALFGLASGVLGLYTLISMDILADNLSSEYISNGGSNLERADGWWYTLIGVIFAAVGFVLCLLDWCDCCGMKNSIFCLHCGTAGSARVS